MITPSQQQTNVIITHETDHQAEEVPVVRLGGGVTALSAISWCEPASPDVRPIQAIHRGHDGFVAFDRNSPDTGHWQPMCSVRADQLGEVFPQLIAPKADANAYFSLNGFYRAKPYPSKVIPELRGSHRKNKDARWLTACYQDFDIHQTGLTVGQAVGLLIDAQDAGVVPPASMITRSGRGLWAYWFLDRGDGHAVEAWTENIEAYTRIQRELSRRLAAIEPDAGARDVARVTRVPGSLNSKAGVRVSYWFQADERGRPFAYGIDALAAMLGVRGSRLPECVRQLARTTNGGGSDRHRRGWVAANANRLRMLLLLVAHRGTIQEGARNRCAMLLAFSLRASKVPASDITEAMYRFASEQCSPALSDAEVRSAIDFSRTMRRVRYSTIADWLSITPEEAALTGFPVAGTGCADADRLRTRKQAAEARRSILRHLFGSIGSRPIPSLRTIQGDLSRHGVEVAVGTIKADLEKLGLQTECQRRASQRREASEHQKLLS